MVIFDFDQTLVDTSSIEHLRSARNWKAVMAQAASLPIYDGISDLINELHQRGHTLAIVTKSPDMVPKAFIRAHAWPIDIIVGYHQVKNRKPHPEGLLLAMSKAAVEPETTYYVGDQSQDTEASRNAGVTALGSAWGSLDIADLKGSNPDAIFDSVLSLRSYFAGKTVHIT